MIRTRVVGGDNNRYIPHSVWKYDGSCYHDNMLWKEYKTKVEAQGVKLPKGWGGSGGHGHAYRDFAGLGYPGTGNPINFTKRDVRLAVAWGKVHALTGVVSGSETIGSGMGRMATHMLMVHTSGWIVMTQGQVYWTDAPTKQVFDKGAICIPALTI